MIKKIISGGQTWPEIAALDLAIQLGIPYAGWRPNIEVPSQHVKAKQYRLHVHPSNDPKDAIKKNVKASDGTFILSYGRLHTLADYARQMTLMQGKQLLGISLEQHSPFETARLLASWIEMNHIQSIFVTGPAGKKELRTYHHTLKILESAIVTVIGRSPAAGLKGILSGHGPLIADKQPETVDKALEHLVRSLSLKEKTVIAAARLDQLLQPDQPLVRYIQKIFNLPAGNKHLMKSCLEFSGKKSVTPNEASRIILKALWESLQKTHRLRIIK